MRERTASFPAATEEPRVSRDEHDPKIDRSAPAEASRGLAHVARALAGLRYGTVTAVVHDGVVVQVERTEKLRLARSDRGTHS
jgi:hypothetical protein